jgi:hypothetical protein
MSGEPAEGAHATIYSCRVRRTAPASTVRESSAERHPESDRSRPGVDAPNEPRPRGRSLSHLARDARSLRPSHLTQLQRRNLLDDPTPNRQSHTCPICSIGACKIRSAKRRAATSPGRPGVNWPRAGWPSPTVYAKGLVPKWDPSTQGECHADRSTRTQQLQ